MTSRYPVVSRNLQVSRYLLGKSTSLCYTIGVVLFTESAFHHGYQEEDFYEVLESRPWKMRSRRGFKDVFEMYGRTHAGEYLHVALREEPDDVTIVFHMRRMTDREKRSYRSRQ